MRSSLGSRAAVSPTTQAELEAMRRKAWLDQGVATLRPDEIVDKWLRQAVVNEAEKRWGKREGER